MDAGPNRPVDPALLDATLRADRRAARSVPSADADLAVTEHLRAEYQLSRSAIDLARKIQEALHPPRFPAFGGYRFTLAAAGPIARADVVRLDDDRVGFWLAQVLGADSLTAELVALFVRLAVRGREDHDAGWRLLPPAEILDRVNHGLIRLGLEPAPLVGLACGRLDVRSGSVTVARAGLPPAVHLPVGCEPEPWFEGGPFLGAFDAVFFPHDDRLGPGDRLVLTTAGTPDEVRAAVNRHRDRPLPELATGASTDLAGDAGAAVLAFEQAG
jgi:serine phosphatase RsbU (regulator of sigma subunit)